MNSRYTPEMDAWLAERYPEGGTIGELCGEFERAFGQPITASQLQGWASSRGVRRAGRIKWTAEMEGFLRSFIPGHSEREIADAFEERFGVRPNKWHVKNAKVRLGVKSGTVGGRFTKGQAPANKGKTWDEMGISEKSRARMRKTWYEKGNEPHNGKRIPLGTERLTKDGYVQVKVRRLRKAKANDGWRMKHHLVWEEANGRPVPPSTMIVFADGDRRNFDPENLVAVPRRLWAVISHSGIPFADRDTLLSAMDIAKARAAAHGARMRKRPCGVCGEEFTPRHPNQKTCDACLEAGLRAPRRTRARKERKQ